MILNISSYLKNSLYSLLILSLSFACTNQNIISNKIDNKENIATQNKNNEYNFYFDGDNTKPEKNNVRIKLSLGTSFNTKAQVRKRVSDITNIQVFLCDLAGNPLAAGYTLLFNNKLDLNDLTLNIRNLPIGTYYAKATARDSGNDNIAGTGDDNILNQNVAGYDISSNSITVNSPALNLSIIQDLKINLALKDGAKDVNVFSIISLSGISNPNIVVDEKGNGIIYWQTTNSIGFRPLKNYVPSGSADSFPVTGTLVSVTASYANGKGNFIYSTNNIGNSYINYKNFSIISNNSGNETLNLGTEINFESITGISDVYKSLDIQIDSKGTGTLVLSKLVAGKYNIFTCKFNNYVHSGGIIPFFGDTNSNLTNPKVSINNNGDGVIVWEDKISTVEEIMAARLSNYTNYNNGIVTAPTSTAVTGVNTKFLSDFSAYAKYIRVENINNFLQVAGVGSDLGLTLSLAQSFSNKKYAAVLSNNDSKPSFSPSVKTNITGNGFLIWKDNIVNQELQALQLSNYLASNNSALTQSRLTGFLTDLNAMGLSLNDNGNGFITFSEGSPISGKGLKIINNALDSTTTTIFPTVTGLTKPLVALNNSGTGISISFSNSGTPKVDARHIIEYAPQ
ncbi:MAG: hypothetical protein U0354_16585 [Candidatus Sericytochromatia bacterium]